MARFASDTVERVKESADFVEIVSQHTELRRAGERYSGLCPFHDERTPSFSLDPVQKLYYCFGCEAHGDVFTFVQEKEGLGFPEAVEALAERYGVEIEREEEDPRAEERRRRRARLAEALERAATFYAGVLWASDEARHARDYLEGRGIERSVLEAFGVGYAPSAWDTLLKRGRYAGFSIEELEGAGLVQRGRKGGHYDRFRARIVFPVRDARGRVQGFGARGVRADQKPKYLNSPEGELYRKSATLYGIERARPAIARSGRAVVVEGYTDVLACHQAGIEEAVAVMGTAITPDQLARLSGYAETVVLALDADRAGRDAMLRAQRVATGRRIALRVASMPAGGDPADLLTGEGAAEGLEAFRAAVEGADELHVFQVRSTLAAADLESPAGRDRALDQVVPVLSAMGETISRDELVREVADRLSADPGLVARRMRGERQGAPADGAGVGAYGERGDPGRSAGSPAAAGEVGQGAGLRPAGPRQLSLVERLEQTLMAMCIAAPEQGAAVLSRLEDELLSGPVAVRARNWLAGNLEDPTRGLPREDDELVSLVTELAMLATREPATSAAMELNFLQLERMRVERQIEEAERAGEAPPVELQKRRAELVERVARRSR